MDSLANQDKLVSVEVQVHLASLDCLAYEEIKVQRVALVSLA